MCLAGLLNSPPLYLNNIKDEAYEEQKATPSVRGLVVCAQEGSSPADGENGRKLRQPEQPPEARERDGVDDYVENGDTPRLIVGIGTGRTDAAGKVCGRGGSRVMRVRLSESSDLRQKERNQWSAK